MFRKMKKYIPVILLAIVNLFIAPVSGFSQYNFDESTILEYQKKEMAWGVNYFTSPEREEFRTKEFREYEELTAGSAQFQFKNRFWNYLDYKQESLNFNFESGPLWGNGNWIDSTSVNNKVADHKIFGLKTNASLAYVNRYFYNNKNYTLVQINAWGHYDWYKQNSTGTSTDSNRIVTPIDEKTNETKLRYGFEARAGWGLGRLNPVNHFMVADYLLQKYYKGRNFSQEEIVEVSKKIREIKSERNIVAGHDSEKEVAQLQDFLTQKMFLSKIDNFETDWQAGEFMPRFQGNRVEFGPFFKYFNREPDFVYGGYVHYKSAKYCNVKWNRNFSASINYNRYKEQDWALAELDFGWSYFIQLKSQLDFGLKYVPGIALNNLENLGPLNHGFIPYVGYFSQINSKTRVNLSLALRISNDESLMFPGPEFSVSIYRSRY